MNVIVTIGAVGRDGDGVASLPDGSTVFVPRTLPGETVTAELAGNRGALVSLDRPAAARVAPPCPHFGPCGGCALQHWQAEAYGAWKRDLLIGALTRAGYADPPVGPIQTTPPASRRRIDLAVQRRGPDLVLGLHRPRDARAIDIDGCRVLHPRLVALLPPLRDTLRSLTALRREGSAVVNLLDTGPDLLLRLDGALSLPDRTRLIALANAQELPRISAAGPRDAPETICLRSPPELTLGGVVVRPPPGAFLQASVEGEAAILAAVLAGLPDRLPRRARIADLYAGIGTLTLPLAARAAVVAMDGDAAAAAALRACANAGGLAGRVTVEHRDLVRRPVMPGELAQFAAVVLDPPHAGAAVQTQLLAASAVRRVIYVSCNPDTLGRDAAVLRAAGFTLNAATPIDQFLWSPRLESVCIFAR